MPFQRLTYLRNDFFKAFFAQLSQQNCRHITLNNDESDMKFREVYEYVADLAKKSPEGSPLKDLQRILRPNHITGIVEALYEAFPYLTPGWLYLCQDSSMKISTTPCNPAAYLNDLPPEVAKIVPETVRIFLA